MGPPSCLGPPESNKMITSNRIILIHNWEDARYIVFVAPLVEAM